MCLQDEDTAQTYRRPRAMKRKEAEDSAISRRSKRQDHSAISVARPDSPLIAILQQYGLLEAVVSNIDVNDLFALLLTSRRIYEALTPQPGSLGNLVGRLRCSGKGVQIRATCHKKSTFFESYNCTEYVTCGSAADRHVETKPCATCKFATCDECRVHVVYQSIYEAPSDPDDTTALPNFSGFVLLSPSEQPLLSPHHLPSETTKNAPPWQDPSLGEAGPYHDQGFLDVPLELDAVAPPERIEDILDIDLGQQSLMATLSDSRYESPSPVLWSLNNAVQNRKMMLCITCSERDARGGPQVPPLPGFATAASTTSTKTCHCTLRKHFLDRWLCLRCYQTEEQTILDGVKRLRRSGRCSCDWPNYRSLCLWCWGEVLDYIDDAAESEPGIP
jgi:hypothetical protein